jgi:tetratricopeptide (TPR) repeat protein
MRISSNKVTALALSAVFACAAGFAPPASVHAAEKQTVSKVAAKPLKAAKDAMDAKKYQEALTRLKEVQAIPGKTPYDEHLMNEMFGYVYSKTNQYAEAAKVLETDLDSGSLTGGEVPKRVRQLLQINYQLKNYDKVIALGDRSIKGGYADDEYYTWVGQAYYLKGDYKGAAKFIDAYITNQVKAGKKPKEQLLIIVQNSCTKTGDTDCMQRVLERLVSYYPKPAYWQNLVDAIYKSQQSQSSSEQNLLQVYRLSAAVDVLARASDYTEYAQLALEAGSPGEAQAILEKGFAKKAFTEKRDIDRNQRLLESAKKQAESSQANLAKTAAEAAAAKTGDKDVALGVAYLGYQQYDKAAEALSRGLAKPGVPNPAEARLSLGIAELGAGHKDEARKAFKAVKGNATLERLANLWSLHAQA